MPSPRAPALPGPAYNPQVNRPPGYLHSTCPHDCPSTCALELERLDDTRIGKVRGAAANSYTAGVICEKVSRYAERVHHPDRLGHPLRRRGAKASGEFETISWDAALDEVAEAFIRAAQRRGSEAVWPLYYAGTMGLVQRDGIERLRHVMRWSRQHSTICNTLVDAGWRAGVGAKMGPDPREMGESDLIIAWGTNPAATQVNVMTHIARARRERGARLIVVDPYRTATAKVADEHLCLRPGTDGALACAVMHILFRDGYADRAYMRSHSDAPQELEAHLAARTPQWAAAICGLGVDAIERLAGCYARAERAFIRLGFGMSRSRNGAANVHAVSCIATVAGKWKLRGGGTFYSNGDIYKVDRTLIKGLDRCDASIRILDQSRVGPILCGDKRDLGDGPPVAAMLVQNTNPVVVSPEVLKVQQGFRRADLFVCVHEQFLTDTAKLADIVLPATTFVEHDDLYQSGGHSHLQLGAKIIEPYAEARSNHEVICALAQRLRAEHPGFRMSAREMIDHTLKASGYPGFDEFDRLRWIDLQPDFDSAHFIHGFPQPDARFHFRPDWSKCGADYAGMPALPDHHAVIELAGAEHPFRMVAAPARSFLNTTFTETPGSRRREQRPSALIHPADCARLGIASGDRIVIGNERAEVRLHAKRFDGLQPGVIVVESIWPNSDFDGGVGVNALVSAEPGPPNGGAVFHDTAVWVRKA
ncbi:MAG: molybdopterin oxidoreductase family protein [Burkholderiales bacterium]|nr:molybdopterin oxidoreductase family protein [Burkholderiales bacterium]